MKKYVSCFILLCLSALVFMACSDHEANKPPETENNQIETEQNLPETETDAPETAPVVLELTAAEEEEITALFNRMIEYEGHCLEPLMLANGGEKIVIDNMGAYYKVTDERFDSWEEWMDFLGSIYTGDALEQVIEHIETIEDFVNIDGYTYVAAIAVTSFVKDDFSFSVEEKTSDIITVKLRRIERPSPGDHLEHEMFWNYKLQKTDEGWRIIHESFLEKIPLS